MNDQEKSPAETVIQARWPSLAIEKGNELGVRDRVSRKAEPNEITTITQIPGDGIGPEVIGAAATVLREAGVEIRWDCHDAGAAGIKRYGTPVPDALIQSLKRTRIALKGPLETASARATARSTYICVRPSTYTLTCVRPVVSRESILLFAMSIWWWCGKTQKTCTPESNIR